MFHVTTSAFKGCLNQSEFISCKHPNFKIILHLCHYLLTEGVAAFPMSLIGSLLWELRRQGAEYRMPSWSLKCLAPVPHLRDLALMNAATVSSYFLLLFSYYC